MIQAPSSPSPEQGMTAREIALVRQSFGSILAIPIPIQVEELFQARLFATDPTTRPLFAGHDQEGPGLIAGLGVVQALSQPEAVLEQAWRLAVRHVACGMREAQHASIGAALLWTLQQGLGGASTPAILSAWARAHDLLSGAILVAAQRLVAPSGRWAAAPPELRDAQLLLRPRPQPKPGKTPFIMAPQLIAFIDTAARPGASPHLSRGAAAMSRRLAKLRSAVRPAQALLPMFLLASVAAVAAPALEYGPEVEAHFLETCAAGRDHGQCRCVLEGMQRLVGVTLFHEIAEGGPDGLSASTDANVSAAMLRTIADCSGAMLGRDVMASR